MGGDDPLFAATRLLALRTTALLDTPPEEAFDRVTRLAMTVAGAAGATLSFLDERREFRKSAAGLCTGWAKETPLADAAGREVVRHSQALTLDVAAPELATLGVAAYLGIPVVTVGEAVGVLAVYDLLPRGFSEAQQAALQDLAALAGAELALRRSLRRSAERPTLARGDVIYRTLASNLPNGAMFLFDRALRHLIADGTELVALTSHTKAELEGRLLSELAPALEESLRPVYQAALRGQTSDTELRRGDRTFQVHGVPVHDDEQEVVAGIALAYDVSELRATEEQLRRQMLLSAIQAGVAVAANESESSVDALQNCVNLICAHSGWPIGHVYFAEPSGVRLLPSGLWNAGAASGYDGFRAATAEHELMATATVLGGVLAARRPVWLTTLATDPEFARRQADSGLDSGFAFPVLVGSEIVAVLEFYGVAREMRDPAWLEMIGYVALQTAHAIERERARLALLAYATEVRELSLVDELTGLYNRRGFLTLARQQLLVSQRDHRKVALLFADLDGMKDINDRFGHDVGDRALVDVAGVLRQCFRASDIVARLGGDEFVAIAALHDDLEPALTNRIQAGLAALNAEPGRAYALQLSIGLTPSSTSTDTIEELLALADRRMYEQKRARKLS